MSRIKQDDPNYERFYGDVGVWKHTLRPELRGEMATVETVTIHHDGPICGRTRNHHCFVRHVIGFHGRGFMPVAEFSLAKASGWNGKVTYGTDDVARQKAEEEAMTLVQKMQADLDESMKRCSFS